MESANLGCGEGINFPSKQGNIQQFLHICFLVLKGDVNVLHCSVAKMKGEFGLNLVSSVS